MGNIGKKDLLYIFNKILIPNCPITRDYLQSDNDIFGTSIKDLKYNTVRKSVDHFRL